MYVFFSNHFFILFLYNFLFNLQKICALKNQNKEERERKIAADNASKDSIKSDTIEQQNNVKTHYLSLLCDFTNIKFSLNVGHFRNMKPMASCYIFGCSVLRVNCTFTVTVYMKSTGCKFPLDTDTILRVQEEENKKFTNKSHINFI